MCDSIVVTVKTADLLAMVQDISNDKKEYISLTVFDEDDSDDPMPAQINFHAFSLNESTDVDYGEIDSVEVDTPNQTISKNLLT